MIHTGAVFIALALLAAACSGDDTADFPPFSPQSPIEELLGIPYDRVEAAAWDDAYRHIAIANCMGNAGFDYRVDPSLLAIASPTVTGVGGAVTDVAPELVTLTEARDQLARMRSAQDAAEVFDDDAAILFDVNFDPERSAEEQQDFYRALTGGPSGPGCLQNAVGAPAADTERDGGLISQFDAAVDVALAGDDRVIAGAAEWRQCMSDAGHDFRSPSDAERSIRRMAAETGAISPDDDLSAPGRMAELQATIIVELEQIADLEAAVATNSRACAAGWLAERARVRDQVAEDFVARYG